MLDWCPSTKGVTKRKWRPSGAKSGEVKVRTTHDLYKDALLDLLKEIDYDASRIQMTFPNGVPAGFTEDHANLILQVWAYNRIHPNSIVYHFHFMMPKLAEAAIQTLADLYMMCRIELKED